MKKTIKKNGGALKANMIGAGLAGLAATAYFFLGPEGKKNQKQAKDWALKIKGEVVNKIEKTKSISEPAYHKIIDAVASKHSKEIAAGKDEIGELAKDLKKHWKSISALALSIKDKELKKKTVILKKKPAVKSKAKITKK